MKKEKVTTSINLTKYINTACDDIKVYTFSIKHALLEHYYVVGAARAHI